MTASAITAVTAITAAFLAAVPPTLVAWAALRQSKSNTVKADAIIVKADEIHELTNSNLQKVTKALEIATAKIVALEELAVEQAKRRRR